MNSRPFLTAAALSLAFVAGAAAPARAQQPQQPDAHDQSHAQQSAGDFYSCPMHPHVKSKGPGRCPVCGMDLRLTHDEGAAAEASQAAGAASAAQPSARMSIPDVELLDQDGRRVHFYTDLVKGKVVAVNFIFTTCTTICPPLGATFARVQRELGERAGRDVHFISITVDPATDTPERLKAWGAKFHAGPGWSFVTGPKPQVDELLRALGAATASPQDHTPTVLIGNEAAGQWTRTYGLARPSVLVQLIDQALAGRLDSSASAQESAKP